MSDLVLSQGHLQQRLVERDRKGQRSPKKLIKAIMTKNYSDLEEAEFSSQYN